jgi:glycerophosphoryl diester phosphodiesterase
MKIIGHRGAKGLAPENTVASLLKAIEHQVDAIEFDLRVTKDGVVILQHDPKLTDPAGNHLVVAAHNFAELQAHKPDLTTFEEAIRQVDKKVPLIIEVKPGVNTAPIVMSLNKLSKDDLLAKDYVLASFSGQILEELHVALPEVPKVVIERWSSIRATYRARKVNSKRLHMGRRWLWWGFIRHMKKRGWEIYPYTINNVRQARRWQKAGIAGIITDYPDRF